jgi:hypothetical protein
MGDDEAAPSGLLVPFVQDAGKIASFDVRDGRRTEQRKVKGRVTAGSGRGLMIATVVWQHSFLFLGKRFFLNLHDPQLGQVEQIITIEGANGGNKAKSVDISHNGTRVAVLTQTGMFHYIRYQTA